jgi:hypothetical protein
MISYTPYATWRMHRRRITPREVEAALAHPEICCPTSNGRQIVRACVGGRALCVAYERQEEAGIVVISVYGRETTNDPLFSP